MKNLDVEIGFPVASPTIGKDDISANIIQSQKTVSAIDLGPYDQQDPTLEEIFAWIQTNGLEMTCEIYYQYLNDTDRPESDMLTMMFLPVKVHRSLWDHPETKSSFVVPRKQGYSEKKNPPK